MYYVFSSDAAVRLVSFIIVFAAMAVWEMLAPRRQLAIEKPLRWASNLGLVFLNTPTCIACITHGTARRRTAILGSTIRGGIV